MEIDFNYENQIAVVSVSGNLDASCAEDLKTKFTENIAKSKDFVFDLEKMDFVDSTGLGALVACLKYTVEREGTIKIANLQKKPKMLFEITRVYKIFDIYDSLDEAVKSCS
jgi:anti-sigma B factor antagonist